jgi:hypothetical protein
MACPRFEDLLRGGSGNAANHAAHCEGCRALLEALDDVDAALDAAFVGIAAPPGLAARAGAQAARETRLRRPSLLPEVLDFIGWAAVLTLAAVLLPRFLPVVQAALARLG